MGLFDKAKGAVLMATHGPVSEKIKKLMAEGKSQEQAVAMALSMEREGRLRPGGVYVPVKKKGK